MTSGADFVLTQMKPMPWQEMKSSLQCLSPNTKDKIVFRMTNTDCCHFNEDSSVDVLYEKEEGK